MRDVGVRWAGAGPGRGGPGHLDFPKWVNTQPLSHTGQAKSVLIYFYVFTYRSFEFLTGGKELIFSLPPLPPFIISSIPSVIRPG